MKRSVPGLLFLLLISACAASGTPPSDDATPERSGDPPASSEAPSEDAGGGDGSAGAPPVLVVTSEGGMLPVDVQAQHPPILVVTADGRVVAQGVQTLEFPGPALPALVERRLNEDGLAEVISAIEATNLFTADLDVNVEGGMAIDAGATVFTVHVGDTDAVVRVGSLGALPPDAEPPPGMSADEVAAYRTLSTLNDRLMTLDTWLDPSGWETDTWVPYEPSAFRLYVRDVSDEPSDPELPEQELPWPTDDDPAAVGAEIPALGDGTRCWVVDGDLAELWYEQLTEANQNTRWTTDDDRRFAVTPRPLMPHEEAACPEPAG
jgi:hypothetical protein